MSYQDTESDIQNVIMRQQKEMAEIKSLFITTVCKSAKTPIVSETMQRTETGTEL